MASTMVSLRVQTLMPKLADKLTSLFKPRPAKRIGQMLYNACVAQSRLPVFYLDYGVEDAIGARFELLSLHVIMVVTRLKSLPDTDRRREQALETQQALFDSFLLALDSALREQGTGDLSVPKKMKHLGQVVYTRMKRWDDLWCENATIDAQAAYAEKTVFAGDAFDETAVVAEPRAIEAKAFAAYIDAARSALDIDALLRGQIAWPEPLAAAPDSAASVA